MNKELEAIKQEIEELQKENKELKEQLIAVNKKLEESESLRSHFLSNIRNEIVNPFTSILGLSMQIYNQQKPELEKIKNLASMIYYEAFILDFQLKNIFAAAEIEAGETKLHYTRVNVCEIINDTIQYFSHIIKQKKLEIIFTKEKCRIEEAIHFNTDAGKLELIFANLLSNAIQFSNPTGKIYITVNHDEEQLEISIKDEGIGIEEENQKIIFDRFVRLNKSIHNFNKGHGLGLSVCSDLIELLSGKLSFVSKYGEGSEFTIILPCHEGNINVDDIAIGGNEVLFDENVELF